MKSLTNNDRKWLKDRSVHSDSLLKKKTWKLNVSQKWFSMFFLDYPHCIQLSQKVDNKVLITFNARNEHDRCKFAQDLEESISEMDEMEQIRIEYELERQKMSRTSRNMKADKRDSGYDTTNRKLKTSSNNQISNIHGNKHSNSLLDINEQCKETRF